MQNLEEFILEKLKISKIERTYKPKTKAELVDIIIREIEANGPECSLNNIDVLNITDMSYLFMGGDPVTYLHEHPVLSKFDGDISEWNVSNVTDMKYMFAKCQYTGKNGDISDWKVSNVKDMDGMFADGKYNGDLSKWDVSNVTNMFGVFYNCEFDGTNGDISNWDVSNVKRFDAMFRNSSFNGDISKWQVNPIAKRRMAGMFTNSPLENNPPAWYNN